MRRIGGISYLEFDVRLTHRLRVEKLQSSTMDEETSGRPTWRSLVKENCLPEPLSQVPCLWTGG